jgi:DNA repair protein RecN (Recombination protein N)
VLLHALGLAVGGRSDPRIVRQGAREARVDARFLVNGPDGPFERVVTRIVPVDGRSRSYLDGRPTTAAAIAELLGDVVDIHAQHEYHRLGERSVRCSHLDRFGGIDTTALDQARAAVASLEAELATLGGDPVSREREIDLLSYQLADIDAGALDPEEPERLETERERLSDVDRVRSSAEAAIEALDDTPFERALQHLQLTHVLGEQRVRLEGLLAELRDLRLDLRSLYDDLDDDPQRLEEIQSRLTQISDLRRRYGPGIADVLAYRERIHEELGRLQHYDVRAAELHRDLVRAMEALDAQAARVGSQRRAAAPQLSEAVTQRLLALDMASSRFHVVCGGDDGGEVDFLLDTGGGRPLPLSRVASGGELARCMLAIDLVLEPLEAYGCVVLDEIDAGLGGATGGAMAAALGELSTRRQVIVVTHLPTVAATAHHQMSVQRERDRSPATSSLHVLDASTRSSEVARMLSGSIDSASLELAQQMLER